MKTIKLATPLGLVALPPIILALAAATGCGKDASYRDAIESIARFREFRTRDTQVEAAREVDRARRSLKGEEQILLIDFYYAATEDVEIGGDHYHEVAELCQEEAFATDSSTGFFVWEKKAGLVKHRRGDCRKLRDEDAAKLLKEAQEDVAKWDLKTRRGSNHPTSK